MIILTVYELIKSIKKSEYESYLIENSEDKEVALKFLTVFERLLLLKPKELISPLEVLIIPGIDYISEELTYIIEGIRKIKNITKIPETYEELETFIERYAFSFDSWRTILSYTINKNTLKNIDKFKIISLIIGEMTELGWEESDVLKQKEFIIEKLEEAQKDMENGNYIEVEVHDTEISEKRRNKMKKIAKINLEMYYQYLK